MKRKQIITITMRRWLRVFLEKLVDSRTVTERKCNLYKALDCFSFSTVSKSFVMELIDIIIQFTIIFISIRFRVC